SSLARKLDQGVRLVGWTRPVLKRARRAGGVSPGPLSAPAPMATTGCFAPSPVADRGRPPLLPKPAPPLREHLKRLDRLHRKYAGWAQAPRAWAGRNGVVALALAK